MSIDLKPQPVDPHKLWRAVAKIIPNWWLDNSWSSPLRRLAVLLYPAKVIAIISRMARNHDFGYGPGRLTGSGFEHVTRQDWDRAYRAQGYDLARELETEWGSWIQVKANRAEAVLVRRIADAHYAALYVAGGWAWMRNRKRMERAGWVDYAAFKSPHTIYEAGIKGGPTA